MAKLIDGSAFKAMIIESACAVEEKKEEINALNVFPVPDGDTGTNMSLTIGAAAEALSLIEDSLSLAKAVETTSSALLRGARGNSGVILSLLFRGFSKKLASFDKAGGGDFAAALKDGVDTAYKSVMKPAEGTILTVSRVSAEAGLLAAAEGAEDVELVLAAISKKADEALPLTTFQNPVLQKAGVIDAGAYGFKIIIDAMLDSFSGNAQKRQYSAGRVDKPESQADFSGFKAEDITFAYCTEFIAARDNKYLAVDRLRSMLEGMGDCVVVVDDDDIIKVHIHTNTPDRALGEGLKYGALSSIKIENMRIQHSEKVIQSAAYPPKERRVVPPERTFGFVAVTAGVGIASIFVDLGVDQLVEGGQTMNPSTEDILKAVDATPAEVVFVLPNNKNIILAAEQTVALSSKHVIVLHTKTIPQGISAMLAFDPEMQPAENRDAMTAASAAVRTGQITCAARDSVFDGKKIKAGDFISLVDGRLQTTSKRFEDVVKKLSRELCKKRPSFITIIYGEGVTGEDAEAVQGFFAKDAPEAETAVICGGQPVYSYIISAE